MLETFVKFQIFLLHVQGQAAQIKPVKGNWGYYLYFLGLHLNAKHLILNFF